MSEYDSHHRGGMWRAWIPPIILMVVALAQITLAKTGELCPWKGGGFGMFSTNDVTDARSVRVLVERPATSDELEIEPDFRIRATQAKLFPSNRLLTRLALAIVNHEQSYKRPVNAVRLEVWRTEFGLESLVAEDRLVRA